MSKANPFNFGGKPCLIVLTPEGAKRLKAGERLQPDDVTGVQRSLHARGLHGEVPRRPRRHLLQLP